MGMPSTGELLLILLVVILVFGTKKLGNIGGDLGNAIKSFRRSMKEGENESDDKSTDSVSVSQVTQNSSGKVIDGQVTARENNKQTL